MAIYLFPEGLLPESRQQARQLARWADGTFDAALALGPFDHLPDPADRDCAAHELARVLRPGGVAFVALMPRCAFLRRTLALPDERHHLASPAYIARVLDDGVFKNDIPGRFTGGYGVRPAEVAPSFARQMRRPDRHCRQIRIDCTN